MVSITRITPFSPDLAPFDYPISPQIVKITKEIEKWKSPAMSCFRSTMPL